MKSAKWFLCLLAVGALLLGAGAAQAHNFWLVPDAYKAKVGETVTIQIGFGHKFPASRVDEAVRPGMAIQVSALGPDGKVTKLEAQEPGKYSFKAPVPGAYMLSAVMKPGFFSRVEGRMKRGNRKELGKVDSCMSFTMIGNAPLFVGPKAQGAAAAPKSQALQVVPQGDISGLKAGDTLSLKVMFQGAPLADTTLKATYAGYQPSAEALAKANKADPGLSPKEAARQRMRRKMALMDVAKLKTDAQGVAQIKLSAPGWWLLMLSHTTPYQDKAVCDSNVFKTSYTFEVK